MSIGDQINTVDKSSAEEELPDDPIPFAPAYDLLAQQRHRLTEEEAAVIALALFTALPEEQVTADAYKLATRAAALRGSALSRL